MIYVYVVFLQLHIIIGNLNKIGSLYIHIIFHMIFVSELYFYDCSIFFSFPFTHILATRSRWIRYVAELTRTVVEEE